MCTNCIQLNITILLFYIRHNFFCRVKNLMKRFNDVSRTINLSKIFVPRPETKRVLNSKAGQKRKRGGGNDGLDILLNSQALLDSQALLESQALLDSQELMHSGSDYLCLLDDVDSFPISLAEAKQANKK